MLNDDALQPKGVSDNCFFKTEMSLTLMVLTELQYRQDGAIPTGPGFCIDGGFFAGEPAWPHNEEAYVKFGFKNNPDVWLILRTDMNGDAVDGGLLARSKDKPFLPEYAELEKKIRQLRIGKRSVNGNDGEEKLQVYPTELGVFSHKFIWEASGEPRSLIRPSIRVDFHSAQSRMGQLQDRSSVTDQQAIELFDSIVNSIRLRSVSATPAFSSNSNPGGNQSISGSPCKRCSPTQRGQQPKGVPTQRGQ